MPFNDVTLRHAGDEAVAALAQELAAEIAGTAAAFDASGEFPFQHFDLLRRRGAFSLMIPRSLGGQGLTLYQLLLFQERLAQGSGATALALGWHLMAFGYLSFELQWPRPVFEKLCRDVVEQGHLINILITERDAGNLLRGAQPTTTARRTAEGYLIRGRKAFCSAAPALDQMVIYAFIEEEDRTAEFLVPRSARVRVIENWNSLGMRATASHDIEFDDVLVPLEARLNDFIPGKSGSFTTGSRAFGLQIAAVYLGIATAARDFILAFANGRHSASLGGSILDAPQVQLKLGEIELLLGASKALLYGLAERWERYADIRHRLADEVAITKTTVTQNAARIVELAMGIAGGHALSKEYPLERYLRDVQCGLYNPPQNDMVVANLARQATQRQRAPAAASTVAPDTGIAIPESPAIRAETLGIAEPVTP
ncbi:acyl-CoA dehydrogenase family protein [Azohydromonas aeria]|uniref:acyl-CoA dehydrogenase family protein n=1 Tax=Azohydromonas aeria TaxID=2590212 RepID=UPI0012FC3AB2|nr:acyl-CoA dehydrogenase family protein [Azohydromonas aeria]